jgi:hypothetical protein
MVVRRANFDAREWVQPMQTKACYDRDPHPT